ncbi:MAG: peptide/nickel transport system permease protein [Acetobacteraceae bacterium]|nr:peptide/nickel transport system permease protein [Acetobacteraceae bacterium]
MSTLLDLFKRILSTIPILVLVGLITFLLIHLTPGDPAAVVAGDNATTEAIEAARHRLGLDQPFLVQFWHWLHGVVTGDLGTSFTSGRPVASLIFDRLPITLSLTAGSTLVGLGISVPLGVFAAMRRGSWMDRATIFTTSLGIAAPEFFIGLLLVLVVALELGLLPATGYVPFADDPVEWFLRLVLPSLTLGVGVAAELARQVRGAMIDVLSRDYIQTARAKGLSTLSIIVKHGLKNAAIPVVTVLGLQIRRLLGGAVIVEQIFAMNGVGSLAVRAVFLRDLPVLLGVALITAVIVLVVNLFVDMSYGYFDPKVRQA